MHELLSRSATEIAKAIRDREVSSEEIARAALERIDEVNPKLNAVVALAADRAMDEARQRDAETARGESIGPLHGVPITLKDSANFRLREVKLKVNSKNSMPNGKRSVSLPRKYAT